MAPRQSSPFGLLLLACSALPLIHAGTARADAKAECIAANDQANTLRQQGKLREAKAKYLVCADSNCPKVVRDECVERVGAMDASIPTVVIAVVDANGNDVTRGKVSIDGEKVSDSVDGRAEPVDPGEHRLLFEGDDGQRAELAFVARQGEKNRTLKITLEAPAEAATAPTSKPPTKPSIERPAQSADSSNTLGWVFGGIGVVALGSFSYFALAGKSEENDLESRCAPRCKQSEADSLHQKYLIADISLGVSLLSLGAATYFFLSGGKSERSPEATQLGVSVGPTRDGFALGARGRF